MTRCTLGGIAATLLLSISFPQSGGAQPVADFYKGKTVNIYVGYGTGTGYDVYARTLGRHIGRHIPGNPTIVVINMPGAGGMNMVNHMYNVAPREGLAIALPPPVLMFEPLYGNTTAKFEAAKFTHLGSMTKDLTPLCMTWHTSPIKTIEAVMKSETLVGATGKAANSYLYPQVLNAVIGTKFKALLGYPSSGDVGLAMERGELAGYCGFTYGSVLSAHPDWLENKRINILVQLALEKNPALPGVPGVLDVTKTEEGRQIMMLTFGYADMNRPVVAPPGIPAERKAALAKALADTLKDPAFLVDAKKTDVDVDPLPGPAVEAIIARLYASPKKVIDKLKAIRSEE